MMRVAMSCLEISIFHLLLPTHPRFPPRGQCAYPSLQLREAIKTMATVVQETLIERVFFLTQKRKSIKAKSVDHCPFPLFLPQIWSQQLVVQQPSCEHEYKKTHILKIVNKIVRRSQDRLCIPSAREPALNFLTCNVFF